LPKEFLARLCHMCAVGLTAQL